MREDSGRDSPFNTQAHTLLVLSAFDYGKIMSNLQSSKLSCCYSNKRKLGNIIKFYETNSGNQTRGFVLYSSMLTRFASGLN